jgi:HEAT repeat protein
VAADEQTLRQAGVGTDGPSLLAFLREQTLARGDRKRIAALIRQLGVDDFRVRERASAELVKLGNPATPLLNRAASDADVEVARRAARCLQRIRSTVGPTVSAAVSRLVGVRRPTGAAEVILAYLPFANDEMVEEAACRALAAVALRDGKPQPVVLQALDDPVPVRRGAAAEALARAGELRAVRRLLTDSEPVISLRVALALAERHEQEAYPTLIRLLTDLPLGPAAQAEGALRDLGGEISPDAPLGQDSASRVRCRQAWEDWWQSHDGAMALAAFRRATLPDADRQRIPALVRDLTAKDAGLREKAAVTLVGLGRPAVGPIREAIRDANTALLHAAEQCIARMQHGPAQAVPASLARLVAVRKPVGAAGVLLAYLPCAEDDVIAEEARVALASVALRDRVPDAVLLQALTDRSAVRRAAAGEALARAGAGDRPAVRSLLTDSNPMVRMRVALALAERNNRQAIPVLIALVGQLPPDRCWPAEEMLTTLAADKSPSPPTGTDAADRLKYAQAWEAWWRQHGDHVDLARLEGVTRLHGFTLIAQWDGGQVGRITELAPDGKTRWEVLNLPWPLEFEILPGNRLLLAEYYDNRVTERNFKGELLWEKKLDQSPILAQRLPNGNTFMATQARMLEVDRTGKDVFERSPPGGILTIRKLRNGRIALITGGQPQRYLELDADGKELKSFPVENVNNYCAMDVLPTGRVLVPQQSLNRIVEYSSEGKIVWHATVQQPTAVARLPNGNTLVACRDTQQVLEMERNGKTVWERRITTGYPWRIRRR